MHRQGHLGVSLMWAGVLFLLLPTGTAIPIIGVLVFTERIPDLDWKLPVEHRGFSHTIWAGLIVATALATLYAGGQLWSGASLSLTIGSLFTDQSSVSLLRNPVSGFALIWIGTVFGYLSHLSADMITKGSGEYGIQPLAPLSQWESSIQLWRADSTFGNNILSAIGVVVVLTSVLLKTGTLSTLLQLFGTGM